MTSYYATLGCTILTFAACCIRARLLACAFLPAFALVFARSTNLVDTSSAHHPLRFVAPVMGMSIAMVSAWWYGQIRFYDVVVGELHWQSGSSIAPNRRAPYASIIVFASCCVDIPATLLWDVPGVFLVQPLQTLACFAVIACLFAPERWMPWRSS
jgi:hypothetical protein